MIFSEKFSIQNLMIFGGNVMQEKRQKTSSSHNKPEHLCTLPNKHFFNNKKIQAKKAYSFFHFEKKYKLSIWRIERIPCVKLLGGGKYLLALYWPIIFPPVYWPIIFWQVVGQAILALFQ